MTHRQTHARVLLVDDGDARAAVEDALRAPEFVVRATSETRAGLRMASDEVPDVMLIGTGLPGSGELLRAVRARDIPVIAIAPFRSTAIDAAELTAIREEAAAYLTRPIDSNALVIALNRAIELRRLREDAIVLRARAEGLATEAERKLRSQLELFSTVAHDVRSHLAAVTMVMVSLARNALPGQERKVVLMRRAVERVEHLVDDLLDLGRLEAGTLKLPLATERAARLVGDAVLRLQASAADRGVSVVANVVTDFALTCDRERVARALEHLGIIVLRVTPRGGAVRLRAEARDGRGRIAVESEARAGHGLELSAEKSADLGAAIAKAIIDAHGGALEISARKFEVAFPLASEASSTVANVAGQEITAASS